MLSLRFLLFQARISWPPAGLEACAADLYQVASMDIYVCVDLSMRVCVCVCRSWICRNVVSSSLASIL